MLGRGWVSWCICGVVGALLVMSCGDSKKGNSPASTGDGGGDSAAAGHSSNAGDDGGVHDWRYRNRGQFADGHVHFQQSNPGPGREYYDQRHGCEPNHDDSAGRRIGYIDDYSASD